MLAHEESQNTECNKNNRMYQCNYQPKRKVSFLLQHQLSSCFHLRLIVLQYFVGVHHTELALPAQNMNCLCRLSRTDFKQSSLIWTRPTSACSLRFNSHEADKSCCQIVQPQLHCLYQSLIFLERYVLCLPGLSHSISMKFQREMHGKLLTGGESLHGNVQSTE